MRRLRSFLWWVGDTAVKHGGAASAINLLGWAAVLLLFASAPLRACYDLVYDSVHFNDARPDFFRMPQPAWGRVNDHRASRVDLSLTPRDAYGNELPSLVPMLCRKEALRLEAAGRFQQAVSAWERYRQVWRREDREDLDTHSSPGMAGLDDRLAALRAWRGSGDTAPLRRYLKARDLVTGGEYDRAVRLLRTLPPGTWSRRSEYLRAACLFYNASVAASARAFDRLSRKYPRDPLPRYMVGRTYFAEVLGDDESTKRKEDETENRNAAPERSVAPALRVAYLRRALTAYCACSSLAVGMPLRQDAEAMAGGCAYRLQDYPEALLHYCRALQMTPPGEGNSTAWISARWCLRRMGPAEHRAFQARVIDDPFLIAIYLDLLLHWDHLGARSNHELGLFVVSVLQRHPEARFSIPMLTRLALLQAQSGNAEQAEHLAAAALRQSKPGAERDQARWQHAEALVHLHREAPALSEYERLVRECRIPRLRYGAHEAAAVLDERRRDYVDALRHYFALEYQLDYAYVIDCLASPEDLRTFLRRYPNHPRARLVRYSLGFRQLRAGEYEAAAHTFASLGAWLSVAEDKYVCELHGNRGRRTPPLNSARLLADAARREGAAPTPAAKAAIAYAVGQFIFHQRQLLFYNGALWTGRRTVAFDRAHPANASESGDHLAPDVRAARTRYQEEHAALYQALRVFDRVAREYPHTKEAPKALYSAALCCTFLPSLEGYWTDQRTQELNSRAIGYYRWLQQEYPHDPLAKAAAQFGGPLSRTRP